jgi:lipopolysaccharide/colanic/teichoic acid biosynthesis glycosyltransferase
MQRVKGAMRTVGPDIAKRQDDPSVDLPFPYQPLAGQVIALVGASGKLGAELVPALRDAGAELVLFGRDVRRLRQRFPYMASAVTGEFAQVAQIRPFSAVIDLATLNNRAQASLAEFRAVNVVRTTALAIEAQAAEIPLFISLSSTHAIDPHEHHPYAISKREAREQLLSPDYPAARLLILPKIVIEKRGSAGAHFWALIGAMKPIALASDMAESIVALIIAGRGSPREVYIAPLGERVYSTLARIVDFSVSLIILVCASWLLVLLAVWVKIDSRGPAIFAQRRVGRHEKLFTLYKFRTMAVGTREAGTHELTADSVTGAGALLRRLKLDELPQVINILKGELALVGPRPCLPIQKELIGLRRSANVFALRPGLTGFAQVNGVDMSDPARLVSWEVRYLRLRRLLFDVRIDIVWIRYLRPSQP